MERRSHTQLHTRTPHSSEDGFTLVELLVVICVLSVLLVLGTTTLSTPLEREEARGSAQVWQAASAWTQLGVLWQGGSGALSYSNGHVAVSHDAGLFGADLGQLAPPTAASANVSQWQSDAGVDVTFTGGFASPNGGGSLFFACPQGSYRLSVRPETGLVARSWVPGNEIAP